MNIRLFFTIVLLLGALGISAQTLTFNKEKKFKIVQFTDVHWTPGNDASKEAEERMNEILDCENPDLVVFTGDIVYGSPASEALDKALQPTVMRNIPFAVTWGNHDDEFDMTRRQLSEYLKGKPNNLTSTTDGISGVTNYILSLKSAYTDSIAAVLYFLDSNSYSPLKSVKGYGWIESDQVEWYRKESKKIVDSHNGCPLPALAFFHIPFPEYNEASRNENALLIGTRKEEACAPKINTGIYAAMLEQQDVMATFVGHDHVNDYVVNWNNILLGYGRFTGGKTVYHDIPGGNGARVIELTEGRREFKSWIRLAAGKIINEIMYPTDFVKK